MSFKKVEYWINNKKFVAYNINEDDLEKIENQVTIRTPDRFNLIVHYGHSSYSDTSKTTYSRIINGVEHSSSGKKTKRIVRNGVVDFDMWKFRGDYHRDYGKPSCVRQNHPIPSYKYLYGYPYSSDHMSYIKYSIFRDYCNRIRKVNRNNIFLLNINNDNVFISLYCKDKLGLL